MTYQASISSNHQVLFHDFYAAALHHYRSALVTPHEMGQNATLAAGVLLCTIGVSIRLLDHDPCCSSPDCAGSVANTDLTACQMSRGLKWTLHLEGLISLLAYRESAGISNHSRLAAYLIGIMGILDLNLLVIGRQTRTQHIWRNYRRPFIPSTEFDKDVEPSFGLPHDLVDLMSRAEEPETEQLLVRWVGHVGDFVQVHLWDAFRFAVVLSQRPTVPCLSRQTDARNSDGTAVPSTDVLKHRVLASVNAVRRAAEDQRKYTNLRAGIRFPLFVAGCHCSASEIESRTYIRNCFKEMRQDASLPRAKDLMRLLDEYWRVGGTRTPSAIAHEWDIEVGLF